MLHTNRCTQVAHLMSQSLACLSLSRNAKNSARESLYTDCATCQLLTCLPVLFIFVLLSQQIYVASCSYSTALLRPALTTHSCRAILMPHITVIFFSFGNSFLASTEIVVLVSDVGAESSGKNDLFSICVLVSSFCCGDDRWFCDLRPIFRDSF